MFYVETNSTDPYYNLAFEEYLLSHKRRGDWLMLWQNASTIVVGMNQETLEEIDVEYVKTHKIRVVRRMTGGGAVYHDLGNLNYTFITDAGDTENLSMERFTGAICSALAAIGVEAEATGRNDITIRGRKISGTAQRIDKGRLLFHGTLLFDSDLDVITKALWADPEKRSRKSTKSIRSSVANIREFLSTDMSVVEFKEKLLKALTGEQIEYAQIIPREMKEIILLAETKYKSREWSYNALPAEDTLIKRARYSGGALVVYISVVNGVIQWISFRGDFMSRLPLRPLEEALAGRRFSYDEAGAVLSEFPLADMFGSISQKEILDTIFA